MAIEDVLDFVPYVGLLGVLALLYPTASSVIDLKYHNHGPAAPGLPRDSDGELIHTLDGVRGWY